MMLRTNRVLAALGVPLLLMTALASCGAEEPSVQKKVAQAMQFREVKTLGGSVSAAEAPQGPSARERLESKRHEELTAAATLPATLPRDLKAACDELVRSYDAFMKTDPNEKNALEWYYEQNRREKLAQQRAGCVRRGSVKAAACAAATLGKDLPSFVELDRTDIASRVLLHCAETHPETNRALAQG